MAPKRLSWSARKMENQKRTHFNPMGEQPISSLRSPIIRLENHKSKVLSCEFHPSGKYILSCNREGQIQICDIYGTFSKMMVMKEHTGAVMEAHFSRDGFDVYSCSTDGTLGIWDTFRGHRKAKLEGHSDSINCVQGNRVGYPLLCSGSNDGTIRIWDTRENKCNLTCDSGADVTTTCFNETGEFVFSGGYDQDIKIWDLRNKQIIHKLRGHTGTVTGISLSPCGRFLLSHSVDNTLRIWDVQPYTMLERDIRCFPSNQEGADSLLRCSWSIDGSMISAGTAERDVYIWDSDSGDIIYDLPGHKSSINDVAFHPKEPIILSASNDSYLFLHEIKNS